MDNSKMDVERWKQAVKAGSNDSNYRRKHGMTETCDDYFVDGVQWADEHPRKGLVSVDDACVAYCHTCDTQECGGSGECHWVEKFRKNLTKEK